MRSFFGKLTLRDVMFSLILLVVVTSLTVVNLAAKYRSSTGSDDSARIAKFEITETGVSTFDISTESFYPGYEVTKELQIHNKSEVAVDYTVTASTSGVLPLEIEIDGDAGNPLTFSRQLVPNGAMTVFDITVRWPEEYNDVEYSGKLDLLKLTVSVTQAD